MMDIGKELQKAYDDGYKQRDSEIVRCKDCKWWKREVGEIGDDFFCAFGQNKSRREDFFCADGERRS